MVLYPEVQTRARASIDEVVDHDRMPSIDDRASLPYLDAIFLEVLRWCPPTPLGRSAVTYLRDCVIKLLAQELHMPHHKMMSTMGTSFPKV